MYEKFIKITGVKNMENKIIISIITVLLVTIISLANVPTVSAHTPPVAGDPPIDPAEGVVVPGGGNTAWSFFYGHSPGYGTYLRDVQWDSATNTPPGVLNRYIGMVSIPWIRVNGVTYTFAAPVPRVLANPIVNRYTVLFTYPAFVDATGDTHSVTVFFDIWDLPPAAPTGTEAYIDVIVTDSVTPPIGGGGAGAWLLDVGVRTDFDIDGIATPGMDQAYGYTPPGIWAIQPVETIWPVGGGGRIVDPVYGMEIMQEDLPTSGPFPIGPWAGIVPNAIAGPGIPDTFWFVLYNPPPAPLEYLGLPPAGPNAYVLPPQGIFPADIIIWDWAAVNIINIGGPGPFVGSVNLRVWMR
jgi:hypothetical protein